MKTRNALFLFVQYLHNEKKLLHGDMKSCNVVIKGDFETVKICDVGVSLQLDENMKGRHCLQSIRDNNQSKTVSPTVLAICAQVYYKNNKLCAPKRLWYKHKQSSLLHCPS